VPKNSEANWQLDLVVRCRLSIREARLMTRKRLNVIAGRNGCGKSQLLAVINSYRNSTNDRILQSIGYRNYFQKDGTEVRVSNPTKVFHIPATRFLAKDKEEMISGAYTFDDLEKPFDARDRYGKLRKALSKLAFDAEMHSNPVVRAARSRILAQICKTFSDIFPGRSIEITVDQNARNVLAFCAWSDMPFVRPTDDTFGRPLRVPLCTMSEGELNVIFLLHQLLYHGNVGVARELFLIDEIENHLHPEAQDKLIRKLSEIIPEQTIVLCTTHSPQVIRSAPAESRILMVHSSDKQRNGRLYPNQLLCEDLNAARLLYELYGASSAEAASVLLSDMNLATAQAVSYAEQSLYASRPENSAPPWDPQLNYLKGLVQTAMEERRPVRILDVGCGTGREETRLKQDFSASGRCLAEFDVVEPVDAHRQRLNRLSAAASDPVIVRRVYDSVENVPTVGEYDMVFLHNVVHEMKLADLARVLLHARLWLRPRGVISIMEQNTLLRGERRFFVYNPSVLARLFDKVGFDVVESSGASYGDIPLYQLTCRLRTDAAALGEGVAKNLVIWAIEETMAADALRYADAYKPPHDPIATAFLAFNLANGRLRLLEESTVGADQVRNSQMLNP